MAAGRRVPEGAGEKRRRVTRESGRTVALFLVSAAALFGAEAHWVGSWAAAQMQSGHDDLPGVEDSRAGTIRQIVHLSIGGPTIRVHLSNAFGTEPLHFSAVHIARPRSVSAASIDPATDQALTFDGRPEVTIPAGAEFLSDPIDFRVDPLTDLALTLRMDGTAAWQTSHPGSRASSWLLGGGDVSVADPQDAKKIDHWYQISGVDVSGPQDGAAVVALGDSITDGHGATTNGNDRWTDALARRLHDSPSTRDIGVLNAGIGGNHLLTDGIGPNALARFDRDVLAQASVRWVIVLEGVNDLGALARAGDAPPEEHAALVERLIAAYQQVIARAHTHGIRAIGATILPYTGSDYYPPGPANEADRLKVNEWIRAAGHFDAVVDFDHVMRDPAQPDRLLPAYDCGDHLHPSPAGYRAMAEAVPLALFSDQPRLRLAFTFDDLPAHGPLPPGETRLEIAEKIVAALRQANLPAVYGFVNAKGLQDEAGNDSVLEAWRAAGNPLGNHSWSHMNLNEHTVADFEADVMKDEPALRQWMAGEDWHWFRFPFLAEGDTAEKKAAIRRFLSEHGYRIAAVTMSFGDYLWNEPYARCKTAGDAKQIAALEESYLAAAERRIAWYRNMSHALYGRDIPYVLLMHIGAFDAEMLPGLLALYRASGFEFITLGEAESDPFYREDTNPSLPLGPDSLEEAMAERGLPLPPQEPFVSPEGACR